MFCMKCGKEIQEGSLFCCYCGADLTGGKGGASVVEEGSVPCDNPAQNSVTPEPAADAPSGKDVAGAKAETGKPGDTPDSAEAPAKKKASRKKKLLIILAIVVAVLVIRQNSILAANYSAAQSAYIREDYKSAYELFGSCGDYRDSGIMAYDALYKYALDLYHNGKYFTAFEKFFNLTQNAYSDGDTAMYLKASAYAMPGYHYDEDEDINRLIFFDSNFPDKEYFDLLDVPNNAGKWLLENIEFDKVREIMVQNQETVFLTLPGRWETEDGIRYLDFDPDSKTCAYNADLSDVPTEFRENENNKAGIADGIYYTFLSGSDPAASGHFDENSDVEYYKIFKITVVDQDTIDVYYYEENVTLRLYRKPN